MSAPIADASANRCADGRSATLGAGEMSRLAQLAFARAAARSNAPAFGRHLALVPIASLELDLADPAQRHFGDYELVELIGEGGMGVVYRARQQGLDRDVALKLLAAGPWASHEFIERFRREAQNAARMQHPNIVPIYEVGSQDEMHYFSMRLIQGGSLAQLLREQGRLAPRRAAQLLRTVAEAVDYAHRLGVLHLDLKPANVLLDEDGVPHVADFGLARRLDTALVANHEEISGTPSYMAPEQAAPRTARITPATDIWGLGAIGYELVCGQPPFLAASPQETLKLVLKGNVDNPRRRAPGLPRDLEAIIGKCMLRDAPARYASARDLADDLGRFLDGRGVHARPLGAAPRLLRWARREPKLAATALLAFGALVVGILATTLQWRRAESSAIDARDNLWATRAQTAQQALAEGDGFRSLRPLIANLAEMEAADRAEEAAIERQRIGTILANAPRLIDLIRLPPAERATSVAIAPDGRHFAVATGTRIWDGPRHVRQYELDNLHQTWAVVSDNRTFLMAGGDYGAPQTGLHYTADGRFLLVTPIEQPVVPVPRYSDMIAFDARDGRVLWPQGLAEKQADIVYDDTAHRALVRFRSDKSLRWPDSAQFYEVDGWRAIGPKHTRSTTLVADFWLPAPDGHTWLGTRDSAHLGLYEVPNLTPRWQLQLPQTSLVRAWRFSRDGRWLALGSVNGAVRLIDVADGHAVELGSGPTARVLRVEFSADDRTLAAIDESGQVRLWDVATLLPRTVPLSFLHESSGASLLRFAGDTLFGGGTFDNANSELNQATLTPPAPFNNAAVPGAARLRGHPDFGTAFDVSATARRLVLGGDSGLLEIWRLPPSALFEAHAAALPAQVLTFDGKQLVTVDDSTVRIADAATGAPISPPLRHPEPVRFAELSPDGHALATIAGRSVRVIDPATWQLRGTPILLPQTPLRAVFAQAAPLLVLTTAAYNGDVLRERIHLIDLTRGAVHGTPFEVDSINDLKIDAQGRYALVMTWNSASHASTGPLRVALEGGAVSCAPKLGELWNFALAADGRSAWFVTSTAAGSELKRWDLDACRELTLSGQPRVQVNAVLRARGDGLIVHRGGREALISFAGDGHLRSALGEAIPDAMYDFALAADGTRAALATRNAVHLIDTRTGRRLSASLTAPITGDDGIAKLAFSPDGRRLLARTINGRWLLWELPHTELAATALTRLARILDPDPAQGLTDADLDALRMQLHNSAPAAASSVDAAQTAPIAFAAAAGAEIDPRYIPLDLTAAVNVPLVGKVWNEPAAGGDLPTLAPGAQRFLGVDYRVDGGVQLSGGDSALALAPQLRRSAVVAVPDIVARRVHVLAFMHIPMNRGVPPRPFAHVVLLAADNHEVALEIRTVRDVVSFNPNNAAASARIAWAGANSASVRSGDGTEPSSLVYAVTLDVPKATGPIRGLRFDVADGPMEAPLFFAATLERDDAGTGQGSAR
ncbi:MAG: protein kinase [Proteobacteria bacterium]|nr:protein kinase [Pseudomonadota bacterium]